MLTDDQKFLLIEAAEKIIAEDFTPKPGWNFPCSRSKMKVMRIVCPDGYEADISIKFKRVADSEKEVQP